MPGSLLVLGGGPVGCELAQFFARIGSKVTLVQAADRLLPRVDAEAAALVEEPFREDGVDVRLGARVEAFDGGDAPCSPTGGRIAFERLLLATGRRPRTGGLDPLGLALTPAGGIEVDERMRAAENVWAIGDATGIALVHPRRQVPRPHRRLRHRGAPGPRRPPRRSRPRSSPTPRSRSVGKLEGKVASWKLTSTPRLSTYERPKRPGFVKVAADPERRRPHRRGRRRAGGRRVAAAAHPRDPRRDADRGAPRRHPALPDVQRGRLPRAPRARTSTS